MDPWKLGPGLLVAGRFEIESLVRSGGMGKLFRAQDRETGGQVALKMLHLPAASDWALPRFTGEMTRLAGLRHPGIARPVAYGETEQGELYVATAWLEGEDLARRLGPRPLRVSETLALARQVAEALALAHAEGLVHGDLKPSRLFLCASPGPPTDPDPMMVGRMEAAMEGVTLLGFGLPRGNLSARTVTGSGEIVAQLRYVAPEQVQSADPPGPQADIFALGCVLFECLVGAPPFTGEHAGILLAQRLSGEVPLLRQMRPELPVALEQLLGAMMAPSPAVRLAQGGELLAALARLELEPRQLELVPAAVTSPPLAARSSGSAGGYVGVPRERRMVSLILALPPATGAG
ncbi:MAG TPA: serine/threonine-protein kinase, partial [Polyangia bacterium]|nr:serine/threonine-protein kinase [Polyangia bacterium]